MGDPGYLRETDLLVRVWGGAQYDSLAVGHARLSIPDGIALVSGDTLRDVLVSSLNRRPPSDRGWVVRVRPVRTGEYVIRGALTVDGGPIHGRDETAVELPLTVRADTTLFARAPRIVRYENVRAGGRYRYADGIMVPIDSSESFVEAAISSKPRVTSEARAVAPSGTGVPSGGVPFVVIVGADGMIRYAATVDLPGSLGYGPEILGPAEDALRRFRFTPATAAGRAVPDYLVVNVRFAPPKPADATGRR